MLRRSITTSNASWIIIKEMEDQIMGRLRNCTTIKALNRIHTRIIVSSLQESNFLAAQMINVCNSNREISYAALIFNEASDPNVLVYNAMIRAYTQNLHYFQAVRLYRQMLRRPQAKVSIFADNYTFPFVLKACAGLLILNLGKEIHNHVLKSGLDSAPVVQNSLIEMYTKCGDLMDAHKVFDEMHDRDVISWNTLISAHARLGQMRKAKAMFNSMPERTVVSWTAMISGYASIGCYSEAVEAFQRMQQSGLEPDEVSIVSVLPACAQLGALELGKWIHAYADKHQLLRKTFVCNALIEMYSKCGSVEQARQLFNDMPQRDVISWSTMLGGLAAHGRAREAVELFAEMERDGRVTPNCITFLGVLSACAHAGLLSEGLQYFDSMRGVYGLTPEVEHYGCMVNLLGRSGHIDRALEMVEKMPMPVDAAIWGSLLSACRIHGDFETAKRAMEGLLELEPNDTGNYVLLSNIYAAAGKWDGVATMRKLIRNKSMKKTPGCSLIEVNNVVREFIAGDDSNPDFGEIVRMLSLLGSQLESDEIISSMDAEEKEIIILENSSHVLTDDLELVEIML